MKCCILRSNTQLMSSYAGCRIFQSKLSDLVHLCACPYTIPCDIDCIRCNFPRTQNEKKHTTIVLLHFTKMAMHDCFIMLYSHKTLPTIFHCANEVVDCNSKLDRNRIRREGGRATQFKQKMESHTIHSGHNIEWCLNHWKLCTINCVQNY